MTRPGPMRGGPLPMTAGERPTSRGGAGNGGAILALGTKKLRCWGRIGLLLMNCCCCCCCGRRTKAGAASTGGGASSADANGGLMTAGGSWEKLLSPEEKGGVRVFSLGVARCLNAPTKNRARSVYSFSTIQLGTDYIYLDSPLQGW
jgi:hypothetical protein